MDGQRVWRLSSILEGEWAGIMKGKRIDTLRTSGTQSHSTEVCLCQSFDAIRLLIVANAILDGLAKTLAGITRRVFERRM
jgi:hypothetical protein